MEQFLKIAACLLVLALLNGCSSGRYYKTPEKDERRHSASEQENAARGEERFKSCAMPNAALDRLNINTVFVHPGMLWFDSDCGESLATESAKVLTKRGYARAYQALCDRNPAKIGEQMQRDPGTRFIGLHYSLGGKPQIVAATLASVAQARQESGKELAYYPLLVDPMNVEQVNTLLDVHAAHLGQMFIVLSAEYSLLRPDITRVRADILDSPKVHLIYAEDFGENWGHFDELESVVSESAVSRFREIFFLIAEAVVNGYSSAGFEARLALLKVNYAIEDSRPVDAAWLRLARDAPCAGKSSGMASAHTVLRNSISARFSGSTSSLP